MTLVNKRFYEAFVALFAFFMLQTESLVIAQETGSHVHGLTELNIVVVNRDLQIEFVSPAINLLGFERQSTSPEETELLNEVVSKLQTAEWLVGNTLDSCQMSTPVFEAPSFAGHEEHEGHEGHEGHEDELETHADFRVQYLFNCLSAPPAEIVVTAFDHFNGIEEISARWIVGRQQGLSQLTRGNTLLSLD
tara:strand:+ start:219 stop:794 length:576 start_codon:yes stop_codon:yes gene_type:complete